MVKLSALLAEPQVPLHDSVVRRLNKAAGAWLDFICDYLWDAPGKTALWVNEHNRGRNSRTHLRSFLQQGDVHEHQPDHHTRKCSVTDEVLLWCADAVAEHQYTTMADAAQHPLLQTVMQLHQHEGITIEWLFRHMQRVQPRLQRSIRIMHKMEFTEEQRRLRVQYCAQFLSWLRRDPTMLLRVIWVDQKKAYVVSTAHGPVTVWGYVNTRWDHTQPGDDHTNISRVIESKSADPKLKGFSLYWYAAVCGEPTLGPIGVFQTTGGSGPGTQPSAYTVRHAVRGQALEVGRRVCDTGGPSQSKLVNALLHIPSPL